MNKIEDLTAEELRAELQRVRGGLSDIDDMHVFTFGKTTAHIGAETAQRMQEEYEQERNELLALIETLESRLRRIAG
jgi:hypothetical protein